MPTRTKRTREPARVRRNQEGLIDYTVDMPGLQRQIRKLEAYSELAHPYIKNAMHQSVDLLAYHIRPLIPEFTGELASSFETEVRTLAPLAVDGIARVRGEHALVQEFGRRPGARMPPPGELAPGETGYLIARAIHIKGMPGKRFMRRGFKAARAGILGLFRYALNGIAQALAVDGREEGE